MKKIDKIIIRRSLSTMKLLLWRSRIALIFALMIVICPNLTYSQPACLRPALKFNGLESLHRIYSEIEREIERHFDIIKRRYENGVISGYLPLPKVSFLTSNKLDRYDYSREKNEITFYISEDIQEKEFKKICWSAYGEWFSQNEAATYTSKDYVDGIWDSDFPYITYLQDKKYIVPAEIKDKIVLDVGTGPGIPGILIAENGAKRVTCLDVSDFMLELAKKEADKRDLKNIVFKKGSAFNLPFEGNSFDMVFVNLVFERQPEELKRMALKEILRVLSPEGKIKFLEFCKVRHPGLGIPGSGWNNSEWMNELKKAGFKKSKTLDREFLYNLPALPIVDAISYIIEAYKPIVSADEVEEILQQKIDSLGIHFKRMNLMGSDSGADFDIKEFIARVEKSPAFIVYGESWQKYIAALDDPTSLAYSELLDYFKLDNTSGLYRLPKEHRFIKDTITGLLSKKLAIQKDRKSEKIKIVTLGGAFNPISIGTTAIETIREEYPDLRFRILEIEEVNINRLAMNKLKKRLNSDKKDEFSIEKEEDLHWLMRRFVEDLDKDDELHRDCAKEAIEHVQLVNKNKKILSEIITFTYGSITDEELMGRILRESPDFVICNFVLYQLTDSKQLEFIDFIGKYASSSTNFIFTLDAITEITLLFSDFRKYFTILEIDKNNNTYLMFKKNSIIDRIVSLVRPTDS